MRVLAGSAAAVVLVFAAACGGGGGTAPTGGNSNPGDTSGPVGATPATGGAAAGLTCTEGTHTGAQVVSFSGTHDVAPADLSVKVGDWVTWTNNGQTNHQIEFTEGVKCGFLLVGKSVSVQFTSAGAYQWNCLIHPSFEHGTITVS